MRRLKVTLSFTQYLIVLSFSFFTQGVLKVRKRVTLMVLTVTTLFAIWWISDTVLHVLEDFGLCTISDVAIPIAHTMIVFNSAVNPFAYALINERFREKMKGMLCNSSCQSEGRIISETSSNRVQRSRGEICFSSNITDQRIESY